MTEDQNKQTRHMNKVFKGNKKKVHAIKTLFAQKLARGSRNSKQASKSDELYENTTHENMYI